MKNTFIFLFVLIADQMTKYTAVANMNWRANTGISFGIFPKFPLWAFFMLIFFMFYLKTVYKVKLNLAWSLFIAGMVGNLIDRVRFGYVIDWIPIPFPFIDRLYINIADTALIIGFICIVFPGLKNLTYYPHD